MLRTLEEVDHSARLLARLLKPLKTTLSHLDAL